MANYPFKINIVTKGGTQLTHYTASLATDADTAISSSVMVDKINAIPVGANGTYTEDEEPPSSFIGKSFGNGGGANYLSASVTETNTGSIVFTDIESGDGGVDYYTFYGSKVCSVLGLPEGMPIYTENFKFSDSSTDKINYMSGQVISDSVQIKEGFKLSSQARVKSNLIWDDAFGEGYVQWVSGSTTKQFMGYDPVKDLYNIGTSQITASAATITTLKTNEAHTNFLKGRQSTSQQIKFEDASIIIEENGVEVMDLRDSAVRVNFGTADVDFQVYSDNGTALINANAGANSLSLAGIGNLDVGAGLDVTGNITVTGTVDGINIAGSLNQAVKTTSAVTFATVNTGQGANELYDMNQNVTTTSTPTFSDLTLTDDLIIADRITHSGDTDTYISFQDNVIDFYTGNTETLELKSTTSTFNGTLGVGADVSTGTLYIKPISEQNASLAEAVNRGLHLSSKADMNSSNKFMPPLVWRSNDSQLVSTDYANIAMIGIETGFHGTNQNRATMVFRTADNETGTGTEHFRIRYDGTLTATDTSIGSNSDIRTKTNIVDYTGPVTGSMSGSTSLELIESLNMKHFEYTGDYGSIKGKKRVGVIAQEVTGSVPYIVTSDMHQIDENWYTDDVAGGKIKVEPTGSLTEVYNVSLGDLVPDMVNAIKDLSQQVKELRAQISGSG